MIPSTGIYGFPLLANSGGKKAALPISSETAGEDYLILYPVYPPLCFS